MWDFIYFVWNFIQWVLLIVLVPVISCILYIYILGNYIQESLWVIGYLSLGADLLTLSYSFFGYVLIFLYFFSTYLWGGVALSKNFNLKHAFSNVVAGSSCLVFLVVKKRYLLWYYYFLYYII